MTNSVAQDPPIFQFQTFATTLTVAIITGGSCVHQNMGC